LLGGTKPDGHSNRENEGPPSRARIEGERLFELTAQGAFADAQQLGGPAAVVAGVLERRVDEKPFRVGQRGSFRGEHTLALRPATG